MAEHTLALVTIEMNGDSLMMSILDRPDGSFYVKDDIEGVYYDFQGKGDVATAIMQGLAQIGQVIGRKMGTNAEPMNAPHPATDLYLNGPEN